MRRYVLIAALTLATPTFAQEEEGSSLMKRGIELFFQGLQEELDPALEEMQNWVEELTPELRNFAEGMGPALGDMMGRIDDWTLYEAPEILPNGDIIIRRKEDAPKFQDGVEL